VGGLPGRYVSDPHRQGLTAGRKRRLGDIFLTLLALGVMSGLGPRTWKLCVVGAFLATAAPFIAWFEEAALFIFLIDRAWIGDVVGRGPVAAPG
jgi:hypothetical protein